MTIIVGDNLLEMQKEVKIESFTTEENINLKNLIAEKIGYSSEFFYFGDTEKGKNIYHGYKTTSLVEWDMISIIGASEDIVKTQKNLETKLNIKLIEFIKNKNYQS